LQTFNPLPKDEARAQLGWDLDDRIVLFNAGSASKNKGFDLVNAAIEVAREIAGPISLQVLRGEVAPEKMPVCMSAADCLVLASRREGSPNVVKEAMACNLPVAAVDVGDVAERLRNVTPSAVVARHHESLGRAIARIVVDGNRSNGREALADCQSQKVAERISAIYKEFSSHQSSRILRKGLRAANQLIMNALSGPKFTFPSTHKPLDHTENSHEALENDRKVRGLEGPAGANSDTQNVVGSGV
jgi:hypothetical protein